MIKNTVIEGLLIIEPRRFGDERGVFSEIFKASDLAKAGFVKPFIQDNLARSGPIGVVRGLHMQSGVYAQDKLIRCSKGAIIDVAVDVRPGSATFGKTFTVELSAQNWLQLLVPAGFAHGYCTLEEDCEVQYKVTAPYAPDHEEGLVWSDPGLAIDWPIAENSVTVNPRDSAWPTLGEWAESKGLTALGAPLR